MTCGHTDSHVSVILYSVTEVFSVMGARGLVHSLSFTDVVVCSHHYTRFKALCLGSR